MRFWWGWPSPVVEGVAGMLLQAFLWAWGPTRDLSRPWSARPVWTYWVAGLAISAAYELVIDCHGWSWADVGGRAIGQVVFEFARAWRRR